MTAWRTGSCAALVVCGAVIAAAGCGSTHTRGAERRVSNGGPAPRAASAARLPLIFERNDGQADPRVRYMARGLGYQLFFTDGGATLSFRPAAEGAEADVLRMRLIGASPRAAVTGAREQAGKAHYFNGSRPAAWRPNVPTFARVQYGQVYPGIDVAYYGREGELEYDFIVAPGVDPAVIALDFEGARPATIDRTGDLVLETRTGRLVQRRPVAYQQVDGERRAVESAWVLERDNRLRFALGEYDRGLPLIIDPVLSFSTFLGGSGGPYGEQAYGVTVDGADNLYITGKTASATFPVSGGQPVSADAFVVKMAPDGSLVYVTVINGNGSDSGEGIAVDAAGQVLVTGFTDSTDFPTMNAVHGDRAGRDAFAFKLDASGALVYSTYLGGSNSFDYGEAAAFDSEGNGYVAGATRSADFPVLNARQPVIKGQDAFVVKLDPAGNQLLGTFHGGSGSESAEAIAVDASASFYITGWTTSSDFPRAQSTVTKKSGDDVYVSQFTPDGSSFVYSRYVNGGSHERALAITLDGEGGVYVGGLTDSGNFPLVLPLQGDHPGTDAFITRLGVGGVISFSTYLGGSGWERVLGLATRDGRLVATGQTFSTDFPTLDAVQPVKAGAATSGDAFVTSIDVVTSTLVSSTYLGGSGTEEGRGVAALAGLNVVAVGWTESADFPTVRAIQDVKSNTGNVFITRIAPLGVDSVSPDWVLAGGGEAITIAGQGFLAGATVAIGGVAATNVTVVDGSTVTATAPALPAGTADVTVTNPDGGSGTLYQGLIVLNGTGPVADAGPDQSVEAASAAGAQVVLNGTGSFDPDDEPLTFEWRDAGDNVIGSGALAAVALPMGEHVITLTVSDGHSAPGSDTVTIRVVDTTAPAIEVVSPNGSNKIFTGTPTFLEWTASDAATGVSSFDVYLSTNGGSAFNATPICANVPGTERSCTWSAPIPTSSKARIRVTARDAAGNIASDISNANFSIVSGAASIKVTSPNTGVNWAAGSTQQIKWNHNLGTSAYTRLELSVDGGATWALIHPGVRNSASSTGVYNWILPNALSPTARVRASWVNGPTADLSDVNFTIATAFISLGAPGAGANWGYGTTRTQTWATNLGPFDRVDLLLDTDGGVTPPVTLAAGVTASAKTATIVTPTLAAPTASARVQVVWTTAPAGFGAQGASPGLFRVEPPFVTVLSPNGGETWTAGTKKSITWSNNLGNLENVLIELSQDDGATYPIVVLAATPSDGTQAVVVSSAWATTQGRLRISWVKSPAVSDGSNAAFVVR